MFSFSTLQCTDHKEMKRRLSSHETKDQLAVRNSTVSHSSKAVLELGFQYIFEPLLVTTQTSSPSSEPLHKDYTCSIFVDIILPLSCTLR